MKNPFAEAIRHFIHRRSQAGQAVRVDSSDLTAEERQKLRKKEMDGFLEIYLEANLPICCPGGMKCLKIFDEADLPPDDDRPKIYTRNIAIGNGKVCVIPNELAHRLESQYEAQKEEHTDQCRCELLPAYRVVIPEKHKEFVMLRHHQGSAAESAGKETR